ncbi:CDP-6-deoxy-delta-3,4-glucoseen reductase [Oleiagrimonas sp. C23AA]|uniref:CDP-6-deoxy-delta-3,4-glucoseen reductase n=1 Tax=Oleiagrimonas sp. C23AA TaxID=2719047 RepID=UPI0031B69F16
MSFTVTLKASGHSFQVAPGQTVLDAAQQAGLALPYSCRAGVCGSCKATVIEGDCHYPQRPPLALNAAEKAHHDVLLCQAVPTSDLLLEAREVASVEDMPMRRFTARVIDKRQVAPDVVCLALQPQGAPLRWLPGQYIEVLLDDGHRRPFSIASAPHQGGVIDLHVRHVAGGGFTSWVFESLHVGDTLELEGPKGTFVPREDSERPIVLMAGGTGFAPVKTLVEHFMHLGAQRPLHLYWGARSAEDLYLRALPERWAAECPTLDFHAVVSDAEAAQAVGARAGYVHECVLADHPDLSGFDIYMCGPPAMIDAGRRAFVAAGLPEERLYFDSFEYAPEVLAKILDARAGIHGL